MKSGIFCKGMQFVFQWEGGYVNHPADPGGATNYGITQLTLNRYRLVKDLPPMDVKDLNKAGALDVYEWGYWKDSWEKLGWELAMCMLDTNINMGIKQAEEFLGQCNGDYVSYLQLRQARYADIIRRRPSSKVFEKGWNNRMRDLRRFIDENRDLPV